MRAWRVVVFHRFEPSRQMQQEAVACPRLHVVAAMLEPQASLSVRFFDFFLGPAKNCDFCGLDCVVNNLTGLLRNFRGEDAQEVLRPRAGCRFQNAKCKSFDMVRLGCLLDNGDKRLKIPSKFLGFLS